MAVVNLKNRQTQQDAIDLIEATLEQAKLGKLAGVTVISRLRDTDDVILADSWESRTEAVGTLYLALTDMAKRAE